MSTDQKAGQLHKGAEGHDSDHHVMPLEIYLIVFGALLVLTGVTVAVSYMNLGPISLPVAMLVALIKASLVLGFFMHLKYESRILKTVFFSSLAFMFFFFAFIFIDISTRDMVLEETGNDILQRDRDNEYLEAAAQRRRAAAKEPEEVTTQAPQADADDSSSSASSETEPKHE